MMVGGYTLDLYCDNRRDSYVEDMALHPHQRFPDQYVGNSLGECKRLARQEGWLISAKRQLCPECRRKGEQ